MSNGSGTADTRMLAADFLYQAATGKTHRVRAVSKTEGPGWQWPMGVQVWTEDTPGPINFVIGGGPLHSRLPAAIAQSDTKERTLWLRRLRRFALDYAMNALDAGVWKQEEVEIGEDDLDLLHRFQFRACGVQETVSHGDLICAANSKDSLATTRAICEKCWVPDPWERCRHITHVGTQPMDTAQHGIVDRRCSALCQIGSRAVGEVPHDCRAGGSQPACYAPSLVRAPLASDSTLGAVSAPETLLSRLNTLWKARFDYPLFAFVSVEPLKTFRMPVATVAEYHLAVQSLSEIMDALDEQRLRDALPPDIAKKVEKGRTVSVLDAFISARPSPWPNRQAAIRLLRATHHLRNLPPTHGVDTHAAEEAIAVAREMGFTYPVAQADWPALWRATLSGFAKALDLLLTDLENYNP